jgi:hypothetical protein
VREESHLDEMRSAIRGDFERLAERRGEQELMRVVDHDEEPEELGAEPPAHPVEEEAPETDPPPGEAEHRSWLARLLSP